MGLGDGMGHSHEHDLVVLARDHQRNQLLGTRSFALFVVNVVLTYLVVWSQVDVNNLFTSAASGLSVLENAASGAGADLLSIETISDEAMVRTRVGLGGRERMTRGAGERSLQPGRAQG